MIIKRAIVWCVAVLIAVAADESSFTPGSYGGDGGKDQTAVASNQHNDFTDLGMISAGLLSPNSWKPIPSPPRQQTQDSSVEADVKTITLTKQVPVPYPVIIEKRVPVRVEVPVDKPFPVFVPRPYHVIVEKKIPYHVGVPVPHPYTVEKHVPVAVRVPVDKPVPVPVPHPYPVFMYRKVPYTIKRHVPYPVKIPYYRPYPVHVPIEKQVPVPVEKAVPYPVHVPVDRPIPIPVEKPVPYPVEKLVPVRVEKLVPVPYKVPVKVHVEVPHPHEASGTHDVYAPKDSQPHSYRFDAAREETNDIANGKEEEYSQVYTGQNKWEQVDPTAHQQIDISRPQESEGNRVRFSEDDVVTRIVSHDHNTAYLQVESYIKVDEPETDDDHNSVLSDSDAPNYHLWPQPQGHDSRLQSTSNDIAEFEKRLKDGRQESYSKVYLGPTAFSNTIHHG